MCILDIRIKLRLYVYLQVNAGFIAPNIRRLEFLHEYNNYANEENKVYLGGEKKIKKSERLSGFMGRLLLAFLYFYCIIGQRWQRPAGFATLLLPICAAGALKN